MQIQQVYEELKSHNLCKSGYDFSRNYMRKEKSYYGVLKARAKEPSLEAKLLLCGVLGQRAQAFGFSEYESVRAAALKLAKLQAEVSASVMRECSEKLA